MYKLILKLLIFPLISLFFTQTFLVEEAYALSCDLTASKTTVKVGEKVTFFPTQSGSWSDSTEHYRRRLDVSDGVPNNPDSSPFHNYTSSGGIFEMTGPFVDEDHEFHESEASITEFYYTPTKTGQIPISIQYEQEPKGNQEAEAQCQKTIYLTVGKTGSPSPSSRASSSPSPSAGGNITVSGKVFDKATSKGIGSGLKMDTCPAPERQNPAIKQDGTWSFQVAAGTQFCVRGPQIPGYALDAQAAVNRVPGTFNKIYEYQVAGADCIKNPSAFPSCTDHLPGQTDPTKQDRAVDTGYDLAYVSTSSPPPTDNPTAPPSKKLVKIEISESPDFNSSKVLTPPFTTVEDQILSEFTFANQEPGKKFVWARFTADDATTESIGPISIELVKDKSDDGTVMYPKIEAVACSKDTQNNKVTFTIVGKFFGETEGLVKSDDTELSLEGAWSQTNLTTVFSSPPENKTLFDVTLIRFDGRKDTTTCDLGAGLLSLGADYFCPAIPDHTEQNVNLTLYDATASDSASAKILERKVTVNNKGIIQGLENVPFLKGRKYVIGIETPVSLRKYGIFEASPEEGTTTISNISLPVGDIAPTNGDGVINTVDKATLVKQWGKPKSGTALGDFNQDGLVNTFDWACMRYNFGEGDDALPSFPVEE